MPVSEKGKALPYTTKEACISAAMKGGETNTSMCDGLPSNLDQKPGAKGRKMPKPGGAGGGMGGY